MYWNLVLAVALLIPAAHATGQDSTWGGWVDVDGNRDWVQLNVDSWIDGKVTADLFGPGQFKMPARNIIQKDQSIQFDLPTRLGTVTFQGVISDTHLTGQLRQLEEPLGTFHFSRFGLENTQESNRFLGSYRTPDGTRYVVVRRAFGGFRLISKTGGSWAFDAYLPWKDNAYFASTLDEPCLPPSHWIEFQPFEPQGDFHKLTIHHTGTLPVEASKTHEIRIEEIVIHSGALKLPGMLMLPPGKGPFPVVVWNHGSGPVTADYPWDMFHSIRMVEELGVAVLNYDKRGSGRSDGNEATATYYQLADDILAAVQFCRHDKRLNRDLIGVGGTSQAPSWPIPIATSRSNHIRFVIALSGQVGTINEANWFNLQNRLKRAGFEADHFEEAREFMLQHIEFIKTPNRQRQYEAFVNQHRARPWFDLVDRFAILDTPLSDPNIEQYRQIMSLDSRGYWEKTDVPVFVALGEDDHLVDVATTAERIRELIQGHGKSMIELHVYPSPAGHAIGTSATPTYFDDLRSWFQKSVIKPYRARRKRE